MNIQALKIFYKSVYYNSMSLAAKELFISQPAASMQIKTLEKELDTTLIERSNKGVIPTEVGQIVFKYAENVLALYENMLKDVSACNGNGKKRLTISCCPTLGEYSLPCSIHEFKKEFEEVEIQIEHTFSYDVVKQVRDRGIDIGFIEGSYCDENIGSIPMGNSQLFFVAAPKLINKPTVNKDELINYNFFLIHRKCALRDIIEKNLAGAKISTSQLKVSIESPSIESIKSSVISGQGISILPYLAIKKELYNKSLMTFEVENIHFPYGFSLIYNKRIDKFIKNEFINYMKNEGKNKLC